MELLRRLKSDYVYIKGLRAVSATSDDLLADRPHTVADEFEPKFTANAERTAFIFEDEALTYAQFDARANQFANWALSAGLKRGDCVALFIENSPDYVAFWYGMAKVGVICALINTNLTGEGLAHCIQIAKAQTVVTTRDRIDIVDEMRAHLEEKVQIWSLNGGHNALDMGVLLPTMSDKRPDPKVREGLLGGDTALFIYTSGTTGLPKAAKMTHNRVIGFTRSFVVSAEVDADDRIYITLPLYHATGGLCGVGCGLQTGAAIILKRKFSASAFWPDCQKHEATMFVYIGEFGRYLMNLPPSEAEREHKVVKAFGNGLRKDVWEEITQRTGIEKIVEFYGSTEGNVNMVNLDATPGAIGRVPALLKSRLPHRLIKIDPMTEQPVRTPEGFCIDADIGEPGEAIGPINPDIPRQRFEGYMDKKASEKKILHDVFELGDMWFRTGDLMRRDKLNYFYFVDRLGDTFRWKSENVSTNEVGEVLSAYEGVEMANVYGVEVPGAEGRAGMAALTLGDGVEFGQLYSYLVDKLPDYAIPLFLRIRDAADTTGTMKLRKVELVKEGFDPSSVSDPLYMRDDTTHGFIPLTSELYAQIQKGEVRL